MSTATVAPLMKVTVSCGAGPGAAEADPGPDRRDVTFVYGIGPEGLVPFERLLFGRTVGEVLRFTVAAGEAGHLFGHLAPEVLGLCDHPAEVRFAARIAAVERPDPREIVRALAAATGHDPCDCGCGCGR
jgi:hypothetical protein